MIDAQDLNGKTVAFVNFGTNTAIDLSGGHCDPPDGTPCIGWDAVLSENQQWKLVKLRDGPGGLPLFRIQNVKAPGKALDLYNGSSSDNTKITGWSHGSTTNDHQLWYIHPVGEFQNRGNVVMLENYGTNTFVDLYLGGAANGTSVVGWQGSLKALGSHQLWFLKFT
ncbi:hypothetical protein AK830_g11430 [Neonectria ditissima]|uniref:Ricin B lectin domain-containing protein n=1 Tax=Neonectria ditissima TaxID=78410 RepID=A0A0P7B313_9HYPO|nr:hypothetical protein AK830_g11430 [Neonectria ditissima]